MSGLRWPAKPSPVQPWKSSLPFSCLHRTPPGFAGLRQLAAVLLKQQIRRHWDASEQGFVEPELSDAEKAAVRPLLLQTIFQAPHAVSTPLGVCTAAVANWDFPEAWPEVLPFLLAAIQPQQPGREVRSNAVFLKPLD